MKRESSLLKTQIELKREISENNVCYFKLIIGSDEDSRIVITDPALQNLINELPHYLSTVIHSQVLIDNFTTKEDSQ